MSRYGYDYRYRGNWNRDLMRGYDREHGFHRGDFMGGGLGGRMERYDAGYTRRFGPAYDYDQQYGRGQARGYDRGFQPGYEGGRGWEMGGSHGGRMPAPGQGGGWRGPYQAMNQRALEGGWGWHSPWQSPIPGQGMRPGFAFGTGHHGQFM
jgi:hypothetical protein